MAILTPLQKEILSFFILVPENELFYLTGGTALAEYYLQHRKSNDLDFFTAQEDIITTFSFHLEETLTRHGFAINRSRGLRSFVEITASKAGDSTLIHLAQDSPFRFSQPQHFPATPSLNVDSLIDIASNKLLALFQRATLRDFIDIFFLVKEGHFTESKLMELAKEKDAGFELYWLGVAFERLKSFSSASPDMLMLVKKCTFDELSRFFDSWREQIVKDLKQ